MGKVAVWCNVSRWEAKLLPLTLSNVILHPSVQEVLIVHTGHTRPRCFGEIAKTSSKVQEVHRSFGEGFGKSLMDGGYDQLSARNFALSLIEKSSAEWLLQIDADEIIADSLLDTISILNDRYDSICIPYYTLTSRYSYWHDHRKQKMVNGVMLYHPRILAWRSSLLKRCETCPISMQYHKNITRHASVSFKDHPYWLIFPAKENPIFHLHCLLNKPHTQKRKTSSPLNFDLPNEVINCLNNIKEIRDEY